jgi:hypothetical protein
MRPGSSAHSELTVKPSRDLAEANRCRNSAAVTSIPNTASIAGNNVRARQERACDLCRRRKTKCDGPSAPDKICSNCVQGNQSCTYLCAYKYLLLSFHAPHLLPAKPPAPEVPRKRSFTVRFLPDPSLHCIFALVISLLLKTARSGWRHCSRGCASHELLSSDPF